MYPSGASMQQQWAAYAALSGQPGLTSGHSITINRLVPAFLDSNNMILRTLGPGIVRQPPNAAHALPGPALPSAPGSYHPHPALGYAFHQALETAGQNPQFSNPYALPPYAQPGSSGSHPLSLSHSTALPYAQSIPYISTPLMPTICNGTLNPIAAVAAQGIPTVAPLHNHQPHHQPHHAQQQQVAFATAAALAAANNNPVRTFDSLKHFGALPQGQQTRRSKPMITSKTNLYISGLSESDTDDSVRSLVEKIVNPKSCKAMVISGKCKGSGFIDCATEEDAEKAKNHILEVARRTGRKLSVKYAFENEKDALNVYVRHLPRSGFTKENLHDMFRNYGHITSVKLMEAEGCLTGIGFVRFANAEQAERAVEQMNEAKCILMDNDKPVTCKLADKADPRRRTSTTTAVTPNAAATAAAVAFATAAMMQQQQHPRHHHPAQLLRATHTQNPAGHMPVAAVVPPSRGLLAPASGALLSAAHNGAMLTGAGTPTNSVNTHAVLPTHFTASPPPQPSLVANHHHLLGNSQFPSLPIHLGQSSIIGAGTGSGSVALPVEAGVTDFQKQLNPPRMVNSGGIMLPNVDAAGANESSPAIANTVGVNSMPEVNGAVDQSCKDQSSTHPYPSTLPHQQDTTPMESKEKQSSNIAGQSSPPIVALTSSPVANQEQQVFMFVSNMNPGSSCPYQQSTASTVASPSTASLPLQQVNYVVTSATTTAVAFDSATRGSDGTSPDKMWHHQSPNAVTPDTVARTSQTSSPFVHASDENRSRGLSAEADTNVIDIISSSFQNMSSNDHSRSNLSSEGKLISPRKTVVPDPPGSVAANRPTDSNSNATVMLQETAKSSNDYPCKNEHITVGSTAPSHQLSRVQSVGEHPSDVLTGDTRSSSQKSHTGNDAYSSAVEGNPPRRSLMAHSTASRQAASGKRHQEASGNCVTSTGSHFRGRRRSDGATCDSASSNSGRSKRPPIQNASGVRGYYASLSSSPPVTPSTKTVCTTASREANSSDHCTPEASHESTGEPGVDYRN